MHQRNDFSSDEFSFDEHVSFSFLGKKVMRRNPVEPKRLQSGRRWDQWIQSLKVLIKQRMIVMIHHQQLLLLRELVRSLFFNGFVALMSMLQRIPRLDRENDNELIPLKN